MARRRFLGFLASSPLAGVMVPGSLGRLEAQAAETVARLRLAGELREAAGQLAAAQLDMRQAQGRRKPASIILVIRVTSDVGRVTASSFTCARAAC